MLCVCVCVCMLRRLAPQGRLKADILALVRERSGKFGYYAQNAKMENEQRDRPCRCAGRRRRSPASRAPRSPAAPPSRSGRPRPVSAFPVRLRSIVRHRARLTRPVASPKQIVDGVMTNQLEQVLQKVALGSSVH